MILRTILGFLVYIIAAASAHSGEWEPAASPVAGDFTHVVFGNGAFVALASGPTGESRAIRSDESGEWSEVTLPEGARFATLDFGGGLFLAAGERDGENTVFSSETGGVWAEATGFPEIEEPLRTIFYGGGYFWVDAQGGDSVYRSEDLLEWTAVARNSTFRLLLWHRDRVLATREVSTAHWMDPDTGSWNVASIAASRRVESWASAPDRIVALLSGENGYEPAVSEDGTFWLVFDSLSTPGEFRAVAWVGDSILLLGDGAVFSSQDGARWADRTAGAETYSLNAAAGGAGRIVAVGDAGAILERPAGFAPVLLNSPPEEREVVEGEPFRLAVEAVGTGEITVEWQKDGTPVPGGTGPVLEVESAGPDHAGSYVAVVSNDAGSVISAEVEVIVTAGTESLSQWQQVASLGGNIRAMATGHNGLLAIGTESPWDQWPSPQNFTVLGISADGEFWRTGRAAYGGDSNFFSAVSWNNEYYAVLTGSALASKDGVAWRQLPLGSWFTTSVIGVHDDMLFTVDSGRFYTSPDGNTWEDRNAPGSVGAVQRYYSEDGRLVTASTIAVWEWKDENWTPLTGVGQTNQTPVRIADGAEATVVLTWTDPLFATLLISKNETDWSRVRNETVVGGRDVLAVEENLIAVGPDLSAISKDGAWWAERSEGLDGIELNAVVRDGPFLFAAGEEGAVVRRALRFEPSFYVWPRDTARLAGEALRLQARATGAGEISYQWYRDGVAIDGEDGDTLEIPELEAEHFGIYTVAAMGSDGTTFSPPATVSLRETFPETIAERLELLSDPQVGYPPMYSTNEHLVMPSHGRRTVNVSIDGRSWLALSFPSSEFLFWEAEGHLIMNDSGKISTDGIFWRENPSGLSRVYGVAYGDGTFVAATNSGLHVSGDFEQWTPVAAEGGSNVSRVAFGGGRFVAVGSRTILVSDDTAEWVPVEVGSPFGANDTLQDVVYGNGVFLLRARRSSSFVLFRSTDGIGWTAVQGAPVNEYLHFAGDNFWASNRVSKDGLNWFQRPLSLIRIGLYDDYDMIFIDHWGRIYRRSPVLEPVLRSTAPVASVVYPGDSVSFSGAVHGSEPMTFRWYRNGEEAYEKTELVLDLEEVGLEDAGAYTFVASNLVGKIESAPFTLRYLGEYATWASIHGGATPRVADEDPGWLGVPNLLRYALHLDPDEPERAALPVFAVKETSGERYPVLHFQTLYGDVDFEWTVEASTDLEEWEPVEGAIVETDVRDGRVRRLVVRDPRSLGEDERRFLRVRVKLPE